MVLTKLDSDNQLDMVCYKLHKLMDMIKQCNNGEIKEMRNIVLNIFQDFKKLETILNNVEYQYKLKSLKKILPMFYTYYSAVPICKIALDIFSEYLESHTSKINYTT